MALLTSSASRFSVAPLLGALLAGALSACGGGGSPGQETVTAPLVSVQPAPATVASGAAATFKVTATGSGPLSYQWSRNGVAIPGATAASYVLATAQATDSAAVMRVEVKNSAGAVTSNPVTLSLNSPGIYQFAGPLAVIDGGFPSGGFADAGAGLAQEARFWGPEGLALDAAGNLYVADTLNQVVRKLTPGGQSSIFAGKPTVMGRIDGSRADARFTFPQSVAATSAGAVYLQELAGGTTHPVRKINLDGTVTTLVLPPDPVDTNADGSLPAVTIEGLTIDAADNLYLITETQLQGKCPPPTLGLCPGFSFTRTAIRRLTPAGVVSTVAASETVYSSTMPIFAAHAITVDAAGNAYIANGYSIVKVTPAGVASLIAGSIFESGNVDSTGSEARFDWISHITVDPRGDLFVIHGGPNAGQSIRRITQAGVVTTVAGGQVDGKTIIGDLPGRLEHLRGIAAAGNGVLYVSGEYGILKIILR